MDENLSTHAVLRALCDSIRFFWIQCHLVTKLKDSLPVMKFHLKWGYFLKIDLNSAVKSFGHIFLVARWRWPSEDLIKKIQKYVSYLWRHQLMCQLSYPENVIPRPFEIGRINPGFDDISDKIEQKEGGWTYWYSYRPMGRSGNWQRIKFAIPRPFPQFWSKFFFR